MNHKIISKDAYYSYMWQICIIICPKIVIRVAIMYVFKNM